MRVDGNVLQLEKKNTSRKQNIDTKMVAKRGQPTARPTLSLHVVAADNPRG